MFHTVLTWHFQSCHSRILRKYQSVPQNHLRHCGLVEKFAWNTVLIICSVKVEFEPSRMKCFWHFALFEIFKETSTIIFMLRIFKISSLASFLIAVENVRKLKNSSFLAISISKHGMVSGIHDIQLINEIRWRGEVGTSRKMRTTHTIAKNVESLMMMLKNFSTLCYTHLFLELTLTSIEISQHSASSQITEFHFSQVESEHYQFLSLRTPNSSLGCCKIWYLLTSCLNLPFAYFHPTQNKKQEIAMNG